MPKPSDPRKPLFDPQDRWTDAANEIDQRAFEALAPIMDEFREAGYSIRQIGHVLMHAVFDLEVQTQLRWRDKPERGKFSQEPDAEVPADATRSVPPDA